MTDPVAPLAMFRRAAVEWAAGGRGQDLVDAAATALAEGVDSPSLRMLAGAPRRFADEEASEMAPDTFSELGLSIEERLSEAAIVEGARVIAARFLADGGDSARNLARTLYRMYVQAGYPSELADWSGFDDYYSCIEEGLMRGSVDDLDTQVTAAAKALRDGTAGPAPLFPATATQPTARRRRTRTWRFFASAAIAGLAVLCFLSSANPIARTGANNRLERRCREPTGTWEYDRDAVTPLLWSCIVTLADGTIEVRRPFD